MSFLCLSTSTRRMVQALVFQMIVLAIVHSSEPIEISSRKSEHGHDLPLKHTTTTHSPTKTTTHKPERNRTNGLSDDEMMKLIQNYQKVLNDISKELKSSEEGKEFLSQHKAAARYLDTSQFYTCNKSLPCSCDGPQYTCSKPQCPIIPVDEDDCAGKPTCFEACHVEAIKVDDDSDDSDDSDKDSSMRHHFSQSGTKSSMLREMAELLPEESREQILKDLTNAWFEISSTKARPKNAHKSRDRIQIMGFLPIAELAIKYAPDIIGTVIDLANHDVKAMVQANRCPCWADECRGPGIEASRCEGVCGNNLGCTFYQCVCPSGWIRRPGKQPPAVVG